jgi:hypothetical protein
MEPRERLRAAAESLAASAADGSLTRDRLEQIRAEVAIAERDLFGRKPKAKRGEGAQFRILLYMEERVGQPIAGEALRELTGIQEWARRVRELRVEKGYDVIEDDGVYTLAAAEPDLEAAARWSTANRIRRKPGSGEDRILEYLKAYVGQVLSSAELIYVARINSAPRRARELRDEHGYRVSTNKTRPDLRPDQYLLETLEPLPASERRIKPSVRDAVFERDEFRCRRCGAVPGPGVWLEVDHILEKAEGGSDEDLDNLQTLCNSCHAAKTGRYQQSRRPTGA